MLTFLNFDNLTKYTYYNYQNLEYLVTTLITQYWALNTNIGSLSVLNIGNKS
jgi:hypothetical protein